MKSAKPKRAAPTAADVAKWATTTKPLTGGVRCYSCSISPEAKAAEAQIVKLCNEGRCNASFRQIRQYLVDEFGAKLPEGQTYWRHLREHCNWRPGGPK